MMIIQIMLSENISKVKSKLTYVWIEFNTVHCSVVRNVHAEKLKVTLPLILKYLNSIYSVSFI
jgi:hypothetical protein